MVNSGDGNKFLEVSGAAVLMGGQKTKVIGNNIQEAARDVSEFGAVYAGRSWLQIGNEIRGNAFLNISRYDTSPLAIPNGLSGANPSYPAGSQSDAVSTIADETVCIMLDDLMSGQIVTDNTFYSCPLGILTNGGRNNYFKMNLHDQNLAEENGGPSYRFRPTTYWTDFSAPAAVSIVKEHWEDLRLFAMAVYDEANDPSNSTTNLNAILAKWRTERESTGSYGFFGTSPSEITWLVTRYPSKAVWQTKAVAGNENEIYNVLSGDATMKYLVRGNAGFAGAPVLSSSGARAYYVNTMNLVHTSYIAPPNSYTSNRTWSKYNPVPNAEPINSPFWYGYIGNPEYDPPQSGGGQP